MKLLIVTQVVDEKNLVLGFFVRWIEEFAKKYESVEVICLLEGIHQLPENVRVHSLGKEKRQGDIREGFGRKSLDKIRYTMHFYMYVWKLRKRYDAVFVHMNQEYILLAGPVWKLLGKKMYLWRNHYAGSWLTDIATVYLAKVFCTSKYSYTAKYKKTIFMPVGVDTKNFQTDTTIKKIPDSILFFARMSPSKRAEMLIDALSMLKQKGIRFAATFAGSPEKSDEQYYARLQKRVLAHNLSYEVTFIPGVAKNESPLIFAANEIFVNCSPSGMFDKMLFEAAASGCIVLATSDDFKVLAGEKYFFKDAEELADKLQEVLRSSVEIKNLYQTHLKEITQKEDISILAEKVSKYIH